MKKLGRVGVIGRFKPLHLGGALMLKTICEQGDYVLIGIGSANKYNLRNPFTAEESERMIRLFLSPCFSNYGIIHVPDFAQIKEYSDGQKWREYIKEHFGKLDYLLGNAYVRELMKDDYQTIAPATIVPPKKRVPIKGSRIRLEMAKGKRVWKEMVPKVITKYLEENNLVKRFRKEFGLQALAQQEDSNYTRPGTIEEEYKHTLED